MTLICGCPPGTSIPDIAVSDECTLDIGQVQKIIFQRKYSATGVLNEITDPTLLLSWTPLLAAADNTKVVQSPFISNPTNEAGAPITFGGGNETRGGITRIMGSEPSNFTADLLSKNQGSVIKALKEYMCEDVAVWIVAESGKIWCVADDPTSPTAYHPVPIHSLFIGDLMMGGRDVPDKNLMQFTLAPNWSDNLVPITPSDFNALTDLVTP